MRMVKLERNPPYISSTVPPWALLAASLLISLGWWHWAETILIPSNTYYAQKKGVPIGNNSDLYPRWLGARELLLHRSDPYGAEVTRKIQLGFYGRAIDPHNPNDPVDPESFAYPVFVVYLLAPFVSLPFSEVEEIFKWLSLGCLGMSVFVWMRAVGFRAKPFTVAATMVLALSTSAAISEYHQQNLSAVVILLLAAAVWSVTQGWFQLGGFLLAWTTVKPQLSWLFIFFFLLWALSNWKERRRLFLTFSITLAGLTLAGEAILLGWIGKFFSALREYRALSADPSILQVLLTRKGGAIASVLLLVGLAFQCWRGRTANADSAQFAWILASIATVTLAVMSKLAAYNQPLLIPALLVLVMRREQIARTGFPARALTRASFACLLWGWGAALAISAWAWLASPDRVFPWAGLPEYTLLALIPVTLLAVIFSGWPAIKTNAEM